MNCGLKKISLLAFALTAACSNQWREGDGQVSAADVQHFLAEVQSASAQGTNDSAMQKAMSLKDDPNTTIYFADAPSAFGPVASVLAIDNLDFLGSIQNLDYTNVSQARVFFLDSPSAEGRQDALVIGIVSSAGSLTSKRSVKDSNPGDVGATGGDTAATAPTTPVTAPTPTAAASSAFTYYAFQGTGSIQDGEFSVTLTSDKGGRVTLRTNDVDGDSLKSVIQLRVYDFDSEGNEQLLGKFSTLTGFAN